MVWPGKSEQKLCVVLFADICGSSRIFAELGNIVATRMVTEVLDTLARITVHHQGRALKKIGDELMSVFESPEDGIRAAMDMQRRISDPGFNPARAFQIKIGCSFGNAIHKDKDVYGDVVIVAARVMKHVHPGQILITEQLYKAVRGTFSVVKINEVTFAGVDGLHKIYEVVRDDSGYHNSWMPSSELHSIDLTSIPNATGFMPTRGKESLRLGNGGRIWTVDANMPHLAIGTHPTNPVWLAKTEFPYTSREHAIIAFRDGMFFLIDRSTLGTYVLPAGSEKPMRLHNREIPLASGGSIAFGSLDYLQNTQLTFLYQL